MSLSTDPDTIVSFDDKLDFFRDCRSYPSGMNTPIVGQETHMSWVFLAGDKAYKLKKPLRLPYLDYSSLEKRKSACLDELRLNRRLAPDVYLAVVPLRRSPTGLSLAEKGVIVDWLVVMRRLDKASMLEDMLLQHRIQTRQLDRLAHFLGGFYRHARKIHLAPETWIGRWRQLILSNRAILFNDRFAIPKAKLLRIDGALCRFLARKKQLISARVRGSAIVEGHGDLRPEHIVVHPSTAVIDCLEFNVRFRMVDPLDEAAYLSVECERLGARSSGRRIEAVLARALRVRPAPALLSFYRCYRAALKARLMLAHLMETNPRKPTAWLPLAKAYLDIADAESRNIQRALRAPDAPPGKILRKHPESLLQRVQRRKQSRFCNSIRHPAAETARYR